MGRETYYENYPLGIVGLSIVLTVLSYALGTAIFYLINNLLGVGYIILCFISIMISIKFRCTFCYYYDKRCFSGLGMIAKLFFKKDNPDEFRNPKNLMLPAIFSFSVLLLPLIGAIILMIIEFSWLFLVLFVFYLIIGVISSFALRKNLFCKYCKQGKIGCPAFEGMQRKKSQMGS